MDICPVGALTSKDFRFQMRVWFLKESKSICTSCATGCNIVIGSREDKVYRYEPRENDAVNSCWMCDYGPAQLQMDQPRRPPHAGAGLEIQGASPENAWAGCWPKLGIFCAEAPAGSAAIIASARQTNEELYLLRKLAAKLGALTDSVPRTGEGGHAACSTPTATPTAPARG